MDQQQATEFSQKALARGATPEQVAAVLAERLNAPFEAILPFVQRVAAQAVVAQPVEVQEDGPAAPAPPAMKPYIEEPVTQIQGFSVVPPPPIAMPSSEVEPLEESFEPEMEEEPVVFAEQEPAPEPLPSAEPEPALDLQDARPRGRLASLYQNPAVQDMVVHELQRGRRPAEVATKLSQQQGVRLSDADRFVAEIAARVPSQPKRKTNYILLLFTAISLIAGLALLVTAGLSLFEYLSGQSFGGLGEAISSLVGGLLLISAGVIGIYLTLRPSNR